MRLPGLIGALRVKARERRLADDWLTSATGAFVPAKYEWRARDLTSAVQRRRLAHTLRLIHQSSVERPLGRRRPLDLTAARHHRGAVRALTLRLESVERGHAGRDAARSGAPDRRGQPALRLDGDATRWATRSP